MGLTQNIIKTVGLVGLTASILMSCQGCGPEKPAERVKKAEVPETQLYFAETPLYCSYGGVATSVGDFNEDGHLDFILTGTKIYDDKTLQSFLYLGDGKGNFKLQEYSSK